MKEFYNLNVLEILSVILEMYVMVDPPSGNSGLVRLSVFSWSASSEKFEVAVRLTFPKLCSTLRK